MGKLRILASGGSPQAQAEARGKLFEKLMADVLRHYGYSIDQISNVNYAGMEIDIEGKAIATGIPLYAECKCLGAEVDSPKFQAFFGKYMSRWLKDNRCQGLFIAIPDINSHAKGFYKENCELNCQTTLRLLNEDRVLEDVLGTVAPVRPEEIARSLPEAVGSPGDWLMLYTEKGLFWAFYVIPRGSGIASGLALFDKDGRPVTDRSTHDYLNTVCPEFKDLTEVAVGATTLLEPPASRASLEEIVEVRGSASCFEYQFPASPEFFVGRETALRDFQHFVDDVLAGKTSSRGILFEANSGWGKSSLVLSSVSRLLALGHFAVAIDSRSASSSQFALRVVDYVLKKFNDSIDPLAGLRSAPRITGFEGMMSTILEVDKLLKQQKKLLVIFLDQFENVFFLPDALRSITDILLKLCDRQTNIVLGFSWKTDLIGSTHEFPYQLRDAIGGSSKRIGLETFSEKETTAILDKLKEELRSPLRTDLRFFLSEFSQGYPWLLKKLCAHVKAQREAGRPQVDIARGLLNVEELFKDDMRGLSSEQEDVLRRIAKAAPISLQELGEEFKPDLVQTLVNSRLVVKIGSKYDIYWDIFRDYLNSGRLPVQENYILRAQVGGVIKATKILAEAKGKLTTKAFRELTALSEGSFYNVVRDMRLLGLAGVDDAEVKLAIHASGNAGDLEAELRTRVRERLQLNRLVSEITKALAGETFLTLEDISGIIASSCPYIVATDETWRIYARIFAVWMDAADLAIFEPKENTLAVYEPSTEVRERRLPQGRRSLGVKVPYIQYGPVERVAERLVQVTARQPVDWTGFKKSTYSKSLAALEDIGFVVRTGPKIKITPQLSQFVASQGSRPQLFAQGALKIESFATFIEILRSRAPSGATLKELSIELKRRVAPDWKDGTALTNAKIMLDWARHAQLAPQPFSDTFRQKRKGRSSKE
jgi:hypothetical protein